ATSTARSAPVTRPASFAPSPVQRRRAGEGVERPGPARPVSILLSGDEPPAGDGVGADGVAVGLAVVGPVEALESGGALRLRRDADALVVDVRHRRRASELAEQLELAQRGRPRG